MAQSETGYPEGFDRTWYVSIGIPMGRRRTRSEPIFGVRRGITFHDLSAVEYEIWMAGLDALSLREMVERTTGIPSEMVGDAMERLARDGLLVRVGDSEESDDQFLHKHRLVAMGFGLGELDGHQGAYSIAGQDMAPRISVDSRLYTIWIGIGGNASMWETCEAVAEDAGESVSSIAAHLLEALPLLVRSGVIVLDIA
jgi:hypothetical protein